MVTKTGTDPEPYLRIIESQNKINGRFISVKRIDSNGGSGNFSLVFTAYDEILKRDVILKFYHPIHYPNLERFARFQREGDILKRLKGQPNIVECIDGMCFLPIKLSYSPEIEIEQTFHFIPMEKASSSIEQFIYSGSLTPEHVSFPSGKCAKLSLEFIPNKYAIEI